MTSGWQKLGHQQHGKASALTKYRTWSIFVVDCNGSPTVAKFYKSHFFFFFFLRWQRPISCAPTCHSGSWALCQWSPRQHRPTSPPTLTQTDVRRVLKAGQADRVTATEECLGEPLAPLTWPSTPWDSSRLWWMAYCNSSSSLLDMGVCRLPPRRW